MSEDSHETKSTEDDARFGLKRLRGRLGLHGL